VGTASKATHALVPAQVAPVALAECAAIAGDSEAGAWPALTASTVMGRRAAPEASGAI